MGILSDARASFCLGFAACLLASASLHGQMLGDPGGRTPPPLPALAPPPPYVPPSAYPSPPTSVPASPAVPVGGLNFDAVMSSNYSQSSFTFDRSMLQAADGFFTGSDPETRRVLAGLNSITVHTYHARDFARYDPGALAFIDGQLRGAGWKHLVNANAHGSSGATDLWLHFNGSEVNNVTVLTRGDRTMTVLAVDCILRPLDLLHLSGHFGIPKVDQGAIMVPAP